jgi:hypothetical protein
MVINQGAATLVEMASERVPRKLRQNLQQRDALSVDTTRDGYLPTMIRHVLYTIRLKKNNKQC